MLTGSIQIKSNHYYVVYRDQNGKQRWKSTKIKIGKTKKDKTLTERQAYAFMEKFFKEKELEGQEQEKDSDISEKASISMPFVEFLDFWLGEIKPSLKSRTHEEYERAVNKRFKPYFSPFNYKLGDLKPMLFSRYFSELKEKGLSRKTIFNLKSILSSAFKFGVHNSLMTSNPIDFSKMPLFNEIEGFNPVIYSTDQVKKLLEEADKADNAIKIFLYVVSVTGARRGEVLGLTWNDVNFEDATITIQHNLVGGRKHIDKAVTTPKTRNGIRTLKIPEKVMVLLKEEKEAQTYHRKLLGDSYPTYDFDFVIRQANGMIYNSPSYINRVISKLMVRAGLPHCRLHDIRHFVASLLFDTNVSVNEISAQLGHGQASTTERIYIHRSKRANEKTAKTIATAIGL